MTRPTAFIDTPEALAQTIAGWKGEAQLAVDTESNSFYAYRERTCLVQVSTRTADWILDPFAMDLAPLAELFADERIEKVFHASEFDVLSLKRDYQFVFRNLYDTLIAAKAVGRKKLGLASLAEELLGLKLAKDEQRSDWGRRPLSKEQIEYAFADTRHLLTIADLLKTEVQAKGPVVLEEVAVDCQRMTEKEPRPREIDPEAFERHPSARKLDAQARQVLRELYHAREERARESDRPPFRIVSDEALGEIAIRKPTTKADLGKIPGVTPPVLGRHGDALLQAVLQALELGPLAPKRRVYSAIDPLEEARFEGLRQWRRKVAEARGVEVEVIAGNAALKALAKANPKTADELAQVPEIDPFRRGLYGSAILHALAHPPPPK